MSDLPENWSSANILELSKMIRGVTYSKNDARDEPGNGLIPILRAMNITERELVFNDLVYVSRKLVKDEQVIKAGDVVIAISSGSINLVGKAKQTRSDLDAAFGTFCAVLRPATEIEPRYFGHFFGTQHYRFTVSSLARGVNINNLKREHFGQIEIPLAPLNEQKRIAEKLDSLLARMGSCQSHLERVPQIIQRFRQSLLAAAISGRLTKDWRNKQKVSEEWKESSFGEAGLVSGGLTKNAKRNSLTLRKPYLRVANVYANKLELDNVTKIGLTKIEFEKTRLLKNDLLIVEGNGSLDQIGRAAIWNNELSNCVHQNHIIRWRASERVLPKFGLFWLLSPEGRSFMVSIASSTSGLYNLSISKVSSIPIKLPSLEEQAEIVRRIESLFAYAEHLEARYKSATRQVEQLTQSLLAKAFRGELVTQDPNDEPAEELLQRIIEMRKLEDAKKKTEPRKKKVKKMSINKNRKPLYETLMASRGARLTPDQLFSASGYEASFREGNNNQEVLDVFYEELRSEIQKGRIKEERPSKKAIYLKGVKS